MKCHNIVITIFVLLLLSLFSSPDVALSKNEISHDTGKHVQTLPGFNLQIPYKNDMKTLNYEESELRLFQNTVQPKKNVIIKVKDPSEINLWKNEIQQYDQKKLNKLKISMNYFLRDSVSESKSGKNLDDIFSAEVTEEELGFIQNTGLVDTIYPNEKIYPLREESIPQINATEVWAMNSSGINITGKGQTVCIIDDGIDYSHPDLGHCNLSEALNYTIYENFLVNGTSSDNLTNEEYSAVYSQNLVEVYNISYPDAYEISLHFQDYDVGQEAIWVSTEDGIPIHLIYGEGGDVWTEYIPGDSVIISFETDDDLTGSFLGSAPFGFFIDKIKVRNDSSVAWNNCSKVIGGYDYWYYDDDPIAHFVDHGTHVAGIIAGNNDVLGVAPDANIYMQKVFSDYPGSSAYSFDIVSAIEDCVNNSEEYNISVISMSLGGNTLYESNCDDSIYYDYIQEAVDKNISVVIATGNNGSSTGINLPSCVSNAIQVSSVNKDDSISSFSNRNDLVKLMAPGGNINSTTPYASYTVKSGTSMATPHISGAILLLNQYLQLNNLSKTPSQIENLLYDSGISIYDASNDITYRRIDIKNAIDEICIPHFINTSWTDWINYSACSIYDNLTQRRNRTQYDANYCTDSQNITYYEYQNITCDFCTPNMINTSWTTAYANGTCRENSTLPYIQNITQYDSNHCGEVSNTTFFRYNRTEECEYISYPEFNLTSVNTVIPGTIHLDFSTAYPAICNYILSGSITSTPAIEENLCNASGCSYIWSPISNGSSFALSPVTFDNNYSLNHSVSLNFTDLYTYRMNITCINQINLSYSNKTNQFTNRDTNMTVDYFLSKYRNYYDYQNISFKIGITTLQNITDATLEIYNMTSQVYNTTLSDFIGLHNSIRYDLEKEIMNFSEGNYSARLHLYDSHGLYKNNTLNFSVYKSLSFNLNVSESILDYDINYIDPETNITIARSNSSGGSVKLLNKTLFARIQNNDSSGFSTDVPVTYNFKGILKLRNGSTNISRENLDIGNSYRYKPLSSMNFEISGNYSQNETYVVKWNYSDLNISEPCDLVIFKSPYNWTTNQSDLGQGIFYTCDDETNTLYVDESSEIVYIQITSFSSFFLLEDTVECGDNVCDSSESCSSCAADCGSCNTGGSSGGGGGMSSPPPPKYYELEFSTQKNFTLVKNRNYELKEYGISFNISSFVPFIVHINNSQKNVLTINDTLYTIRFLENMTSTSAIIAFEKVEVLSKKNSINNSNVTIPLQNISENNSDVNITDTTFPERDASSLRLKLILASIVLFISIIVIIIILINNRKQQQDLSQ